MNQMTYKNQKMFILITFLCFPLLLLAAFTYYPAVKLIQISLTSWDGYSSQKEWVGLDNYMDVLRNPVTYEVLGHNAVYFLVGLLQLALSLYFAVVLNTKIRARNFFRSVLFVPYMLNSVAIAFMFQYLLSYENGALNLVLRSIGLDALALKWLGDPHLINFTFGFMNLWKYMGFMMVIFLGALQSIPHDIYEAAEIDGANSWQKFAFITFPGIRRIIELNLFLNLGGALASFEFPFSIYPLGSPFGMGDTFVMKTLQTAFKFNNFGLASAMGVVLMFIVIVLLLIQRKLFFGGES